MDAFKKPSRRRAVVIAGVAGIAVAGAVGIGAAAYADGPSTGSPSVAASGATQPSGAPSAAPAAAAPGAAANADGSAARPTPPKHEPHIGGTVESVSGSTVTVKDMDGFTRTIVLGDSVKVSKAGSTATSSTSSITKGEHIDATGTVDSNGTTLDATAVTVGMPTPPAGGPKAGGPAAGGPKAGGPKAGGPKAGGPAAGGPAAGGSTSGAPTPPAAPEGGSAPAAPAGGSAATPSASGSTTTGS